MNNIKKTVEGLEQYLKELFNSNLNVNTFMQELANIYFSNVAYISNSNINTNDVEDVEDYYDELFEQDNQSECIFETFTNKNFLKWEDFILEFNEQYKNDIVTHLKNNSKLIVKEVNDSCDN